MTRIEGITMAASLLASARKAVFVQRPRTAMAHLVVVVIAKVNHTYLVD
jgi:hypothetical protein